MKKLDKQNIEDIFALTPMQEGMLFHYLKDPGSELYFEQISLGISGKIDNDLFEKAWNFVIETNEMLRAVFRWEKVENPMQIILKRHKIRPRYYDFSGKEPIPHRKRLEELKIKDRAVKFDLRQVPFRVTLCKIEEAKYEIIISNHHILYDGWSNGIILKEFFAAYEVLTRKQHLLQREPKTKFKEFLKWLRIQDNPGQEEFWQDYLKDFNKKAGFPLKRKEIKTTGSYQLKFPGAIKNELECFVKRHNITIASFLYSMWGILLQRYNSTNDVLFDTTVSGRSAKVEGIENMVGLFINTLPLRVQSHPHEKIPGFLSRMYRMLQQRGEFESSSLKSINEYLDGCRSESLFDSVIVIENYPLDIEGILIQESSVSALSVNSFSYSGRTLYDLTLICTLIDDIKLSFTYNNQLFDEEIMAKLGEDILDTVHQMAANSQKKVIELPLLPEEVSEKILNRCKRESLEHFPEPARVLEKESQKKGGSAAPRDMVEKKLVDIWSALFRVSKADIGINTNFFDFGGHSLKASLLVARIHKEIQVKVPLAEIFKFPTIKQLAQRIRNIIPVGEESYRAIEPVEEKEYYTASSAQQRMYTLQQMEPDSIAYNTPAAIIVGGIIEKKEVRTLEKTFNKLINRHISLRTSFELVAGEPVQVIHRPVELGMLYQEIEASYRQDESTADNIIEAFIKPFYLNQLPLIRVALFKLAPEKHLLLFDAHHIISDGTSMNVFIKEFMAFYSGVILPPLRIQYKDLSEWQKKRFSSKTIQQQAAYWLDTFSGQLPVLNLPTDYPRSGSGVGRFEGDTLNFKVIQEVRQGLRSLEKSSGATLYMILLAAYNVLLMKYSSQEDIVVGTLTDGRSHSDLENVIGVLITTLAIRNFPAMEKRFCDFLQEVKINSLKAFENSDYQFEELLKHTRFNRESDRNPLFDTMFLLQNYERPELSVEGLAFKFYPFKINASTFDLRMTAVEVEKGIDIEVQYATRLFKKETIARFAGHYVNILKAVGTDARQCLGEIPLPGEDEKRQILHQFNRTVTDTGEHKSLVRQIEEQVRKTPDSTAILGTGQLTYRLLNEKINQLARLLKKQGIKKGSLVGILLSPSPQVAAAMLAIWKAGGAYIPITPNYPPQRIADILADSGVPVLLSQTGTLEPQPEKNCTTKTILLDQWESKIDNELVTNPDAKDSPNNLAYIIYTSGSTGKPKGAGVFHRGFYNLMTWFTREFNFNRLDRNLVVTSLSFDLTQKNVFAPLITGGILTFPGSDYFEPAAILRILQKRRITWMNCTPSMIYSVVEFCDAGELKKLASLRFLFLGGEPIFLGMLEKWLESGYFNVEIVNTYGPTECADICAFYRITQPQRFFKAAIPTGKPIYNTRLYVLDRSLQPLPLGVPGELFISGQCVGVGYINRIQLTSEKFITHPLEVGPLYRTGDLVKWLASGNIEFIGRLDFQIKIRGFRIELEEIEIRLVNHESIKAAVVLAKDRIHAGSTGEAAADKYLCSYYTSDRELDPTALKQYLSAALPDYMIPAYFIRLETMPLNPNGKIDRKALPEPDPGTAARGGQGDRHEKAGTGVEKKLVKIWQEVLGIERIGINDNFFELGGQSLLAVKLVTLINNAFDENVQILDLFRVGTIKGIAGIIKGQRPANHTREIIEPFNLNRPPLFRALVVKQQNNGPQLYLHMHRILSEEIAMKTIKDGFSRFYADGFKGGNGREGKKEEKKEKEKEWCLITLSAGTGSELNGITRNLVDYLQKNPGINLADAAFSLAARKKPFQHRRTAVCSDVNDAVNVFSSSTFLNSISRLSPHPTRVHTSFSDVPDPPVVFMFPGQGAQYVNMGLGLYQTEPVFREETDRCFEILTPIMGRDLREILYPIYRSNRSYKSHINRTEITQPVIFVFEYALAQLLMKWGIKPASMIGHSLGEYVAACLAGVFPLEDALSLIAARGKLVQTLPPGSMLSVSLPEKELTPLLKEEISLAAVNSSSLCVVSGLHEKIIAFMETLNERGCHNRLLTTSHAFHSKMMEPILAEYLEKVSQVVLNKPSISYISNVTGKWIKEEEASDPMYWVKQLRSTVRFNNGLEELLKTENPIFIEVGPGRTLSTFVNQHKNKKNCHRVLNFVKHPKENVSDTYHLLNKIGDLWLYGKAVDWSEFYSHQERKLIHFPPGLFEVAQEKNSGEGKSVSVPSQSRPNVLNPYLAPRSKTEQIIANTWKELLGHDQVGVHDNFFELNGDSLKAAAFETLIHKELNVKVPLSELFNSPTVEKLAGYIDNARKSIYAPIVVPEKREYYELSSAQKRMYFLRQMDIENTYYNISYAARLEGKVNKEKLLQVFCQLIKRHESFRTAFEMINGEIFQKIQENVEFEIEDYDMEEVEVEVKVEESKRTRGVAPLSEEPAAALISSFIRAFDLSRAPLLRVGLIKVEEETHLLMVDMHHIISDGVSIGILIKEFMKLYNGEMLPGLRVHYKAFPGWQNKKKADRAYISRQEYWSKQFRDNIPILNLPSDFQRPEIKSFEGKRLSFYIDEKETAALKVLALKEDATLFMVLLAAFNVLLFKLSGQEDIIVGTPAAGRLHPDLRGIIGMFVNTLALRNFPGPGKTFTRFLWEVKKRAIAAFENQEYQFEDLIEQVTLKRDLSRNPLFDVMFAIYKLDTPEIKIPGLRLKPLDDPYKTSKFDMMFIGKEEEGRVVFIAEYCTKLFKEKTIKKYIGYFKKIVSSVLEDPIRKISEIETGMETESDNIFYPASNRQRELFSLDQSPGKNNNHTIREKITLEKNFDPERVNNALQKLIQEHEALRKSFEIVDGEIMQKVHRYVEFDVDFVEADHQQVERTINRIKKTQEADSSRTRERYSLSSVKLEKKKRRRRI